MCVRVRVLVRVCVRARVCVCVYVYVYVCVRVCVCIDDTRCCGPCFLGCSVCVLTGVCVFGGYFVFWVFYFLWSPCFLGCSVCAYRGFVSGFVGCLFSGIIFLSGLFIFCISRLPYLHCGVEPSRRQPEMDKIFAR